MLADNVKPNQSLLIALCSFWAVILIPRSSKLVFFLFGYRLQPIAVAKIKVPLLISFFNMEVWKLPFSGDIAASYAEQHTIYTLRRTKNYIFFIY